MSSVVVKSPFPASWSASCSSDPLSSPLRREPLLSFGAEPKAQSEPAHHPWQRSLRDPPRRIDAAPDRALEIAQCLTELLLTLLNFSHRRRVVVGIGPAH